MLRSEVSEPLLFRTRGDTVWWPDPNHPKHVCEAVSGVKALARPKQMYTFF